MSRIVPTLLVAALVVLAGCAGGIAGPDAGVTGDSSTDSATDSGNVQFYVSDERNAIDQFDHLNVTVTSVGFAKAGAGDANETEAESDTEVEFENESEGGLSVALVGAFTPGENATVRVTHDGEPAANVTAEVRAGDREVAVTTDANGTATVPVPANATEFGVDAETDGDSAYGESQASVDVQVQTESDDGDDDSGAGWVERDIDERTVDLTDLQGANATALGNLSVPEGDYEKVFVHVGEVNGTLATGEAVTVKLPSQKLQLNENVTVGSGESVDFVFDITVFEAGNAGKFVLKPVASESGTDVPIQDVDAREKAELDVSVVGNATAGENATVRVTQDGDPVENATVALDEDTTVRTDANGTATVLVPEDGDLELEASYEDGSGDTEVEAEGELELELGDDSDDSDDSDSESGDADDGDQNQSGSASAEADLAVAYEGTFAAGETVTVTVTDGDGEPVEDATVELDGEVVGETDADGELSVELPADVSMTTEMTVSADGESVTVDASTVAAAN